MSTPAAEPGAVRGSVGAVPATVVLRRTARRAVRSGAPWGYVFGIFIASSAWGYDAAYKTARQRLGLARTFGSNAGVNAIIGPAHRIDTVAGFTAWRSLGVLGVVGAVWGLLAATRLLRGEEEAGRWELLLAGQTTPRRAAAQALAGLGAGLGSFWALTALLTVVVGRFPKVHFSVSASLYFALCMVAGATMFLAVGALASQLAATRRQAAAWSAACLGLCYALRMVADAGAGLGWMRWVSPLGWVEELQPLTAPRPLALAPIGALVVVAVALAVVLAGRRDVGASLVRDRDHAVARTRLLSGPGGLTVRLVRPALVGWCAGTAAFALVCGLIAKSAGSAFASSSLSRALGRLGARGAGADAYLGVAFLVVAVVLTLVAAGQMTAARAEEAEGRVEHLLVRCVGRASWLGGRVVVTIGAVVVFGMVAGVCAWLAAATQDSGVGLEKLIEAGLNVVAPAIFVLGAGVTALGLWPRAVAAACYTVVAWSFLVEIVGGIVNANHWLLDTSVFHQMASAPAVAPDWVSAVVVAALGLLGVVAGGAVFNRRDLVAE